MADFTVTIPDALASLAVEAFAAKYGVEPSPAQVMAQVGIFIAGVVDEYARKHAVDKAHADSDTLKAAVQAPFGAVQPVATVTAIPPVSGQVATP